MSLWMLSVRAPISTSGSTPARAPARWDLSSLFGAMSLPIDEDSIQQTKRPPERLALWVPRGQGHVYKLSLLNIAVTQG